MTESPDRAPTVSVVLPVYDRAGTIARAIESVLAQSFTDLELIVIDDGSTDATPEIVRGYLTDPRVRFEVNPRNLGAAGTRNRGIALARGAYVAFQDSDDRWLPEKLALQMEELARSPDCRVCYCGALYYAEEQCYYIPRRGTLQHKRGDLSAAILSSNPTTPQTLLVDRALIDQTGAFDDSFRINEDWELAIRLAQASPFAFVPEPLVLIYRTANSLSSDRAADTATRARILRDHAPLYARNPTARARQAYIIGCQNLQLGQPGTALRDLAASFRDAPSLVCLAQMLRAAALALRGSVARRFGPPM